MNSLPGAMQPFAWGGIALQVPAGWETGMLGEGYALLEYRFQPVLELKTALIRGRFSFQRHMKQLMPSRRSSGRPSLQPIPIPSDWPAFSHEARVQTFRWQGLRMGGVGLVHYCRSCRRATLIQFYDHGDGVLSSAPHVLKTFRDHGPGSGPSFAVYDIRGTLPERFVLQRFQFDAGCFTLNFSHSRERVALLRWSPANVMLAGCGGELACLAEQMALLPPAAPQGAHQPVDGGLEWQWRAKTVRGRLRAWGGPPAPDKVNALRIWHRPRANRILGVRAEALPEYATFERICRSYGIIQKEKAAFIQG